MATAEWIGLHSQDRNIPGTYAHAIDRMINAGADYSEVLEDLGKTAVTRTTDKLLSNRVRPKTTRKTLLRRRTRSKKRSTSGITLVDNAIGIKQVAYSTGSDHMEVGIPTGPGAYMAAHQKGKVPHAPKRMFLVLPTKQRTLEVINFHWKKAIRS